MRKPLRLWPGIVLAVLLALFSVVLPAVAPEAGFAALLGGLAASVGIVLWWLFFSRAPWSERIGAIVLMAAALCATLRLVHPSIQGGMMGMMLFVYLGPPVLGIALVCWAVATKSLGDGVRRVALVVTVVVACALLTLIRTDGLRGNGPELAWRWTPTPEARLLASSVEPPVPLSSVAPARAVAPSAAAVPREAVAAADASPVAPGKVESAAAPAAEWSGFRGPARDGVSRAARIETDWTKAPPKEMWRRPIGPGWSSFAVRGDVLYTQEQRGEEELVAAYRVSTGQPVWRHADPVRFYESNGGAGPRATPTLSGARVFAFGATGILNALDAATGAVMWSRNAAAETGIEIPDWGFTSSPLIVDDLVIVAVSGALAAYDRDSGEPRWSVASKGGGYSSPHLATLAGVPQVLLLGGSGVTSVAPADGKVLWENAWKGVPIVQPAVTPDGDVLITTADAMGGAGLRRLSVRPEASGWKVEERWTSNGLKPYFNDYVINAGHVFGFDGRILSCISLEDGERKWKNGRYGQGQLILLGGQDVLLVLSEDGELALVGATADTFTELARIPALKAKTWNHPVVVGDVLLIRNGEEMAALRLPLAAR